MAGQPGLSRFSGPEVPVLLSGGETDDARRWSRGRNTEFCSVARLPDLRRHPRPAADTDGIDGSEDNAGAFVGADTPARAAAGMTSAPVHGQQRCVVLFFVLGDLLVTGPGTRTNVNDFRAIPIR